PFGGALLPRWLSLHPGRLRTLRQQYFLQGLDFLHKDVPVPELPSAPPESHQPQAFCNPGNQSRQSDNLAEPTAECRFPNRVHAASKPDIFAARPGRCVAPERNRSAWYESYRRLSQLFLVSRWRYPGF